MTRTRTHTWYAVDACRVPTASLMSTDGAEDVPLRLSVCSSPNLRWLISHWNRSILLLFIELSDGATLELSVSIIPRADRWINANSIKFDWFIDRIDRNDVCLKEDRPGIYRASMKDRSSWHDLLRRMIYFECLPRESTKRVYQESLPKESTIHYLLVTVWLNAECGDGVEPMRIRTLTEFPLGWILTSTGTSGRVSL